MHFEGILNNAISDLKMAPYPFVRYSGSLWMYHGPRIRVSPWDNGQYVTPVTGASKPEKRQNRKCDILQHFFFFFQNLKNCGKTSPIFPDSEIFFRLAFAPFEFFCIGIPGHHGLLNQGSE